MDDLYDLSQLTGVSGSFVDQLTSDLQEGLCVVSGTRPAVTICGSARVVTGDKIYTAAEALSRAFASRGFTVITGGGPGVMEAANKGAFEAGGTSIGVNIWLPQEQRTNSYTGASLRVRYLFVRKLLLFLNMSALICLPGGYGTLDELFEVLNLMQVRQIRQIPVVLFGSWFWQGLVEWIEGDQQKAGLIDATLVHVSDDVSETVTRVEEYLRLHEASS